MEPNYPNGSAVDPFAIPGLHLQHESDSCGAGIALEVDGEMFELRPDENGGTSYSWLTGPDHGYGFGSSPTLNWSLEAHRRNIRSFLAQIDPTTGHIEDH